MSKEIIDKAALNLIREIEDRHKTHTSCKTCVKKMNKGEISESKIYHQKTNHNERHRNANELKKSLSCTCLYEKKEIQRSKKSPLISSSVTNRKVNRREAVAEKNEIERKLANVAVKILWKSKSYECLSV